jgi:hypothetical protein
MTLITTDDYSPRYVGDTGKPLVHQFIDKIGAVHDLTGVNQANMTFVMKNKETGTVKTGGGSWTILTPATDGQARYTWVANDVNEAGIWLIQAYVPFPDGGQHFSIKELEILAHL